jgi:hypothetical protein
MMPVAKGYIDNSCTYHYTCGNCKGIGHFMDSKTGKYEVCTHCYDLDYAKLIDAFRLARGEQYYAILKAILSLKGKDIHDRVWEIGEARGKYRERFDGIQVPVITVADMLHLLMEFQFPQNRFKPLVEWLEECRFVPTGTHDKIRRSNFKVRDGLKELGYDSA